MKYEVGDRVVVSGVFGEPWLSALYGSSVGPSHTPYKFSAQLEQVNSDGSYRVSAFKRVLDRRIKFHSDSTRCLSYPCNENEHRVVYRVWYKKTNATVYSGAIKGKTDYWPYVFSGQDSKGFYKDK